MMIKVLSIFLQLLLILGVTTNCKSQNLSNHCKLEDRYHTSELMNIPLVSDSVLQKWQQKVMNEGDNESFDNLLIYYEDGINSAKEGEIIPYILIMAENYAKADASLLYYQHIVQSDSIKENIDKAIKHLKIAFQELPHSIINELARLELEELYRMGKYSIKKDTIIANYLRNGGCNIDSILIERKK